MSIRCSDDLLYSWETKSPKKCGTTSVVFVYVIVAFSFGDVV
jgi:hypothetical protein